MEVMLDIRERGRWASTVLLGPGTKLDPIARPAVRVG
jgi:hypothetical protein